MYRLVSCMTCSQRKLLGIDWMNMDIWNKRVETAPLCSRSYMLVCSICLAMPESVYSNAFIPKVQ